MDIFLVLIIFGFLFVIYITAGAYYDYKGIKNKYIFTSGGRDETNFKDIKQVIKWELFEFITWSIAVTYMICSYILYKDIIIGTLAYMIILSILSVIIGRFIVSYKNDKRKKRDKIIILIFKLVIYAIWFKVFAWRAINM